MNGSPRVSIVVRSLGRPTLRHTLKSLRNQTYGELEVVIVNAKGGGHPPIEDGLGRHLLRFVDSTDPLGAAAAANRGLLNATGDYIGFLDDDDTYEPEHVSTLIDHATSGGHEVVYSGVRMIDQYHRIVRERLIPYNPLILHHYCFIAFTTVLFHRRFVEQGCRFDESLEICEDWDFWLQLSQRARFEMVPAITVNYFMAAGSSGTGAGANQRPERTARYTKIVQTRWNDVRTALWEPMTQRLTCAISMHQSGDREGAASIYREILTACPDEPSTLHALGRYELDRGNVRAARRLVQTAISLNGDAGEFHLTLGMISTQLGDRQEAVQCYRRAVQYVPQLGVIVRPLLNELLASDSESFPALNGGRPNMGATPVGRNRPCPCGSGRRYKECCGRSGAPAVRQISGAGRSAADASIPIAPAPEQINLIAQLMRRGEVAAAKNQCEQVLATQPAAAEVIRILGMIALEYGRLDEAGRYFQRLAAMDLDWPGLHENVREWRARKARFEDDEDARKRLRVLPIVAGRSAASPQAHAARRNDRRRQIHLITMYRFHWDDDEQHTRQIASLLAPHSDVTIWSPSFPRDIDRYAASGVSFHRLQSGEHGRPDGGSLVFIGAWQPNLEWLQRTQADRIIVLHTADEPDLLSGLINRIMSTQPASVEMVYCSKRLSELTGRPGRIEYAPVSLDEMERRGVIRSSKTFTLGKLCRNAPSQHHPNDPALYRQFIARGYRVRVMSGSFAELFFREEAMGQSLELLPIGVEDRAAFLGALDCFFYRTHPAATEGFAQGVAEAMAAGLPVVCARGGGHAELVEQGVTGFLFDDEANAIAIVERLAADPAERATVGRAAQELIADRYGSRFQQDLIAYYLG